MRVAIIRQRYTPYGGAERFVEGALEALLERGVAISLYTREWPQTRLKLIEPTLVDPFHVGRLWRDASFAREVCRAIGTTRADLVQSHERVPCCDVYRAGDGVHAVYLDERLAAAGPLERIALRASPYHHYVLAAERRLFASPWLAAVICNSEMVRDEIRERFGYPDAKLHVIRNAVDADAFHPGLRAERERVCAVHRIPAGDTVFLLVGSGYGRKGVATAIRALAALPPTTHLVVVGREAHPQRYARLARSLGLSGRVHIAGPQTDPRPYFGAADAFVLPTLYDPCPNAALEAMACALPVVTSAKSGVAEILLRHDAGLVCPSRDDIALAAHMRALLDPALRERVGANARRAVLPLTPGAMTLELVLLYRELLAASAARRRGNGARATPARPVPPDPTPPRDAAPPGPRG
ncbi:UDP-glucose:(heptosyl)LPS alpha-1,3-glucosyltransferase [Burkholderiales bacterium]|nr:UDP-glucose:(heptosyl)LPS alpha-1,3-glucosyltransferase [Burkholderiales bacterium]